MGDQHLPARRARLPAMLRPLFWECEFSKLTWEEDRDLVVARVLTAGSWEAIGWLRGQMGDAALREWMVRRRGRGLSPRQLRFWELILDLPHRQVNAWLGDESRRLWDDRTREAGA